MLIVKEFNATSSIKSKNPQKSEKPYAEEDDACNEIIIEKQREKKRKMAMLLRRAISYRNSVMLIRSCNSIIQSRNLLSIPVIPKAQILPSFDFLKDNRRGFAKGKRSSTSLSLSLSLIFPFMCLYLFCRLIECLFYTLHLFSRFFKIFIWVL